MAVAGDGVGVGHGVVTAAEEQGVLVVEQGVDAVEAREVAHGQVGGVQDRLVAVQLVEPGQVGLEDVGVRLGHARYGVGGEYLEGLGVELGQLLAAVRPDHPPTVGVGPREEAAEVAGAEHGVEALVVGDHHVPVGTGTGEGGAVLLVAAPVRDRVLGVGEERVARAGMHVVA